MDSLDNSEDRKPRSMKERLDRLEEIFSQLTPERQDAMMDMLNAGDLAEDLRKAIADSGLTHYAIGKASGVNIANIDRFVSGERDMRVATASKICAVLGYGLAKIELPKPSKKKPTKKAVKKKPGA